MQRVSRYADYAVYLAVNKICTIVVANNKSKVKLMEANEKKECLGCGAEFETYAQLAGHILGKRDFEHQRGRRWARSFIQTHLQYIQEHGNRKGKGD